MYAYKYFTIITLAPARVTNGFVCFKAVEGYGTVSRTTGSVVRQNGLAARSASEFRPFSFA